MPRENEPTISGEDIKVVQSQAETPHLIIIYGKQKGRIYSLEKAEMTIGRDRSCDIFLDDVMISRIHCRVSRHRGGVRVRDLESTNGTFINGEKIEENGLSIEGYLQVGKTIFKLGQYHDFTINSEILSYATRRKLETEKKIAAIEEFINTKYADKITLADLALEVEWEEHYLSSLFRKQTGHTVIEYLNMVRILKSCDLLKTTKDPVLQIAVETGFQNLSLFNRTFKKIMGKTPKEFRKEQAED